LLTEVCADLATQLVDDAEGASKRLAITVTGAATEDDAVDAARAVARSALLKCAVHGEDPNWGRVLAALGTSDAAFDPDGVAVSINGVAVCRASQAYGDLSLAREAMRSREVEIVVTLDAGTASATVLTTDLTAAYVHENSAYST
jgi:glutamate N-acetyltransferase/amino-acid N-acetyltransferase